jgi:hypothetical protein
MNLWLTWNISAIYVYLLTLIVSVAYYSTKEINLKISRNTLIVALLLILHASYGLIFSIKNFSGFLGDIFLYSNFVLVLQTSKQTQADILDSISKWFSILLLISIFTYILASLSIIPPINTIQPSYNPNYPSFLNYIFYVKVNLVVPFYRFNGPFVEPGHLGMICALLLYANNMNFKSRYNVIILVSLLLSLSLAGYILLLIGIAFTYFRKIKAIIIASIVFFSLLLVIANYVNSGDNIVNKMIFQRLQFDQEKGIAGNNRFIGNTDYVFNELINNGGIWFGNHYSSSFKEFEIRGSGYKIYLIQYGIIGTFLIMFVYFLWAIKSNNRIYALLFFLLILITFIQRAYPFWFAWFLPFIAGISRKDISSTSNEKQSLI